MCVKVTREATMGLLDPHVALSVANELNSALASQLTDRLREGRAPQVRHSSLEHLFPLVHISI